MPTLADVIEILANRLNFSDPGERETIDAFINAEREGENDTITLTETGRDAVGETAKTSDTAKTVNAKK